MVLPDGLLVRVLSVDEFNLVFIHCLFVYGGQHFYENREKGAFDIFVAIRVDFKPSL